MKKIKSFFVKKIEKYYYILKLWIWWKVIIKKNEFSKKLDFNIMRLKFKNKSIHELSYIIMRQRDIAHDLDAGESKAINIEKIKKSLISIF